MSGERTCLRSHQPLDGHFDLCGMEDVASDVRLGLELMAAAVSKLAEAVLELARRGTP